MMLMAAFCMESDVFSKQRLWILVPPSEALQVKETEAVALYQDGRVGAPVLQTWQIQAQQAVSTDLRWLYVRPWQTDEVAKAVTCHIVAK